MSFEPRYQDPLGWHTSARLVGPEPARRKIRVACILNSTDSMGGAEKQLRYLLEAPNPRFEWQLTALLSRSSHRGAAQNLWSKAARCEDVATLPASILSCVRRMRADSPDIVVAYGVRAYSLAVAARLAGASFQLVLAVRGTTSHWPKAVFAAWRHVSVCIANTRAAADEFTAHVPALRDRTIVIPNGINLIPLETRDAHRALARRELELKDDEKAIISTASLLPIKRHEDLLAAMSLVLRRHPKTRLFLIGEGPSRPLIERLRDELHLEGHVHLLGFRADAQMLVAGADIVALTSRSESMPNALMEAMSLGLPVVATRVGGVPELVRDRVDGILVPPFSPGALSSAFSVLFENPARAAAHGRAGRQRIAEDFSIPKLVERTTAELLRLCGSSP